jgi:hypothetical protein
VFVDKSRRPLACGRVRVAFMVRKNLQRVPVQSFNTPRGTLLVSTPEPSLIGSITSVEERVERHIGDELSQRDPAVMDHRHDRTAAAAGGFAVSSV